MTTGKFCQFMKKPIIIRTVVLKASFFVVYPELELSHSCFFLTYDVSDCGRPKYCEKRHLSAKKIGKHSKTRLCSDNYTLGDI